MITIGITSAGSGIAQSVLRALSYGGMKVRIVAMDTRALSVGLYWAHAAYLIPPVAHSETYLECLLDICKREQINALIPGLDLELATLAWHRDRFDAVRSHVIVSSPEVIDLCRDKYAFSTFCQKLNLPFVRTYLLDETQRNADHLEYPVIVKPRDGSGSQGVCIACSAAELRGISAAADMIVQPYLPVADETREDLSSKPPARRLEQRNEYSLQFYVGQSGQILGCFASINRLKNGVPIEITPIPDTPALSEALPIVEALIHHGLRGPINLQGRHTTEGVRFFETNPRFTGITGLRAGFGYREVEAALWDWLENDETQAGLRLSHMPGFVGLRYVSDAVVPQATILAVGKPREEDNIPALASPIAVLVTGASGFIGANLVAQFLETPGIREIRCAVRNSEASGALARHFRHDSRLRFVIGELPGAPWDVSGIDVVVHAAALRQDNDLATLFSTNIEGTRRLLQAMREAGVRRMVYLSSQSIYGTSRPPLWVETAPPIPETAYATSKWLGEHLCLNPGMGVSQTLILRLARVYGLGYGTRWQELPHRFSELTASGLPLPVFNGGHDELDMLHIHDLVQAVTKAATSPMAPEQNLVMNIGGGAPISVHDLAKACQHTANGLGLPAPEIAWVGGAHPVVKRFGMDIQRASMYLGWAPEIDIYQGIRDLISAALTRLQAQHAPSTAP